MGRPATRQRPFLPSPKGCSGGHRRQPPPLLSLQLAGKDPTQTARDSVRSASRPARFSATAASSQRAFRVEETPTAATAGPGGCCFQITLRRAAATRSGRPLRGSWQAAPGWCAPPSVAAAPPLRRAALLRRGPCPPPAPAPSQHPLPPPRLWGLEKRGRIYCGAARPAIRSAEAVTMRAQSSGARTQGSEHSGAASCG